MVVLVEVVVVGNVDVDMDDGVDGVVAACMDVLACGLLLHCVLTSTLPTICNDAGNDPAAQPCDVARARLQEDGSFSYYGTATGSS